MSSQHEVGVGVMVCKAVDLTHGDVAPASTALARKGAHSSREVWGGWKVSPVTWTDPCISHVFYLLRSDVLTSWGLAAPPKTSQFLNILNNSP